MPVLCNMTRGGDHLCASGVINREFFQEMAQPRLGGGRLRSGPQPAWASGGKATQSVVRSRLSAGQVARGPNSLRKYAAKAIKRRPAYRLHGESGASP